MEYRDTAELVRQVILVSQVIQDIVEQEHLDTQEPVAILAILEFQAIVVILVLQDIVVILVLQDIVEYRDIVVIAVQVDILDIVDIQAIAG